MELEDPSRTIDSMVANLTGLEARAKELSMLPEGMIIPQEGKQMFEELVKLQELAQEKIDQVETLKIAAQGHSVLAFDIDKKMAEIEAVHGDKIGEIEEIHSEERAKTQRVLESMRERKLNEMQQLDAKEEEFGDLEKDVRDMLSRIEQITKELETIESSAEEEGSNSGTLLKDHMEKMTEKNESLRLEIIANDSKYEKATSELASLREQWNAVKARKEESNKRLETLDKNLAKKRQAKANTEAQLAALESQASALRQQQDDNQKLIIDIESTNNEMKETTTKVEEEVEAALTAQELIQAAVASTLQQTSRLEAKVKVMADEKERLLSKIANYEEASQAFCFGLTDMFKGDGSSFFPSQPQDEGSSLLGAYADTRN